MAPEDALGNQAIVMDVGMLFRATGSTNALRNARVD